MSFTRLVLLALAVMACNGGASASGDSRLQTRPIVLAPVKFTFLPTGWRAFDGDFGLLTHGGGDLESYALSWAYRPNPVGWANAMPRNAIAVTVLLLRTRPDNPRTNLCLHTPQLGGFPALRRLPLRLPPTTGSRLEGSPQVREYRVFARLDGMYNIDLRVDINNTAPTRGMLRTVQRIVDGLLFPAGRGGDAADARAPARAPAAAVPGGCGGSERRG